MSLSAWIVPPLLLAGACGFAFWVYRRRELPVAGRWLLAAARGLAIFTVSLLIWNPRLPASPARDDESSLVLLDGSLSMAAGPPGGETVWSSAVREAGRVAGREGRILVFGDAVSASPADRLETHAPAAVSSRLLPALRAAAESGARTATVLSDGRLSDADMGGLPTVPGLEARLRVVDAEVANAGIADFVVPERVERGASFAAELTVFGEAAPGAASARVEVREEGRRVASAPVEIPASGGVARVEVDLRAPAAEGPVRYTAAVALDGDGFAADDERVRYVRVAPPQAGLVLLSLRPDWEPRHLLPVLEDVTGLPARGFLRVVGPRYLPLGRGSEVVEEVSEDELRAMLAAADVAVLHGVDASAPGWVRDAARVASRLLVFPADRAGASLGGMAVAGEVAGEWYVAADLPASPLAGEFAGLDLRALPPLTALRPAAAPSGSVAVRARLGGRGAGEPVLVLSAGEGRRVAVGLARGFWRWAAREGTPRRAYRSLWAGVASWLFADERVSSTAPPGPAEPVVARGRPVRWEARGMAGRNLGVVLSRDGETVFDSTVAVDSTEAFATAPLEPGVYDFAVSPEGDGEEARGRFDVERYSGDLRLPRVAAAVGGDAAAADARAADGRPLRTHPAPFLLVLAVLCGEWIGRRRQGLR